MTNEIKIESANNWALRYFINTYVEPLRQQGLYKIDNAPCSKTPGRPTRAGLSLYDDGQWLWAEGGPSSILLFAEYFQKRNYPITVKNGEPYLLLDPCELTMIYIRYS